MASDNDNEPQLKPFAATIAQLRRYLNRHYRAIAHDHEDLIQDTLVDLVVYLRRRADQPSEADVNSVANVILKRRVVDRYRKASRLVLEGMQQTENSTSADAETDVEERARFRNLLLAVMGMILEWNEDDQKLLLHQELEERGLGRARSVSERKRLSRLRQRLRDQLRQRFGVEPKEYLGG